MHGLGPFISCIVVCSMIAGVNFGLAMGFMRMPSYAEAALPMVILGLLFLTLGVSFYTLKIKAKLDEILAKGDEK